jgi:cytochrome c55X
MRIAAGRMGLLLMLLWGVVMVAAGFAPAAAQTADTQPSADQGRRLYGSYCARCHGLNMVTPGATFFDLRTLTPGEQERFERSVNQGLRAMPAWGSILKPGDVQALWMYVMAGR